jgi:hypothetical protein
MNSDARIIGLARITGLIMDQHLAELRLKKAAQTETRGHIAALDQRVEAADVALAAAALAGLRYAVWADQRKAALNVTLARQTVAALGAEDAARVAFARNAVMERLATARDPTAR